MSSKLNVQGYKNKATDEKDHKHSGKIFIRGAAKSYVFFIKTVFSDPNHRSDHYLFQQSK